MSDPVPGDCRACARCCFSESPEHVRVFECDWDRMNEHTRTLTTSREDRRFMRFDGGRCAALVADLQRGWLSCGVYEQRPDVCRSLERGTSICLEERNEKAGRPEALLVKLRGAHLAEPK
ncbi:MAG: YkgJ family cysteine cluster protein [Polyangiaceae bacterium]|nr:YkgJ family cysteine cluster protein [Polyangiaceae bacterium]